MPNIVEDMQASSEWDFKIFDATQLSPEDSLAAFIQKFNNQPFVVRFNSPSSQEKPLLFTTLLHGNETSGLEALRRLVDNPPTPICDTYILVASVKAASTAPMFFHRMLPGLPDLNRCFSPETLQQTQAALLSPDNDSTSSQAVQLHFSEPHLLAFRIWRFIMQLKPRWLIDLHNTSGASPAFTVVRHLTDNHVLLCQQFSPYIIRSNINMGAIFELPTPFPCITVECGGTGDELANQTAFTGMHRLMMAPLADLQKDSEPAIILTDPIRLEVKASANITLNYGNQAKKGADITLLEDIDRFNFASWEPGQSLGWATESGFSALTAVDEQGRERIDDILELKNNSLQCKTRLHLFMITNRVDIALSDCLLYAVILRA
ncbi:succinylglutamate desuccinylase/aspartoacylase family protein [Thalassotalea sp. PS06]|uniref:succinylglutamate desuccinylase/aspartoacylase domain-containing protein n=1 Tax=Thalassotalea sp. PS06 TaxID=2594005 RepID=UPI00163D8847|nr:succinylglutamate desuccinylase/aspartoacylase family protein [Thalassotalea sp. PS06]